MTGRPPEHASKPGAVTDHPRGRQDLMRPSIAHQSECRSLVRGGHLFESGKYQTELNGQGENQINSVTISGIEASCYTDQAVITLFKNDPPYSGLSYGVNAWTQWGTISGPSITLTFGGAPSGDPKPLVADVAHYNVMFSSQ